MNKKLVFFFLSALAIAGCAKEPQTGESVGTDAQDANFSILASSDVFTKTELCNCKEIVWKTEDCLSVWEKGSATNANVKLTLDASTAGTQSGLFKGTLTPAADFELYAIYPYNAEYGNDHTALSLTIPTSVNQSADVNSIVGDTDFMLGKASSEDYDSESGAYKMLFKHPLAFVQFHIDGRDCIYEQATIKSLTMKADVAFVGAVNVNLEDGTVVSAAQDDEGKTLVINFPETAKMKDPQDAWVAINPVDLSDANCKFALEMTNGQKVTFTVNPGKMNGQSLYKFEFSDIDAKIAAGKGAVTPVRIDRKEDGSYCPANCYIVKEGGYYQFDARSVDKVNLWSAEGTYSAKWLWSTGTESIVDNVGFSTTSGRITIMVKPNSNGNAVVALYKDGAIVWSWHIWCTTMENPMSPTHHFRNNSWSFADVNIGATSKQDVDAYGMYYQWGRKDPFPADKSKCVFNEGVEMKGVSANTNVTSNSLKYTIENPTIFLYENSKHTWISSDEAEGAQSLWYSSTANRSGKTNYDPCPPGYIVPVHHNDYGWRPTTFKVENMTFTDGGMLFTHPTDNVSSYYPAAGYLKGLVLTDAGTTVRCWAAPLSATPTAETSMAGYSILCNISAKTITNAQQSRAAFALPVRCMKQ